jgi:hypothetical protein
MHLACHLNLESRELRKRLPPGVFGAANDRSQRAADVDQRKIADS